MWRVLNSRQERTCPTLSKQYTDEFKAMVVELYKSGKPASEIMREYGLTSSTFYKWTKAKAELAVDGQVVTTEEVRRESVKNFVLLSCNLSLLTEDGI